MKHKYNKGQTVYKIKWLKMNGYAVDAIIKSFKVIETKKTCDLMSNWYYLWDSENKITISEMEIALYKTEREAKEQIKYILECARKVLKSNYDAISEKLENSLNNITNELA